jgi:hypothetical protein
MPRRVQVAQLLRARLSEVEALWYDPQRWASFVDGFGHVARLSDDWPAAGATLSWDSLPGGRGRVVEHVEAYTPGEGQTSLVEDETLSGRQQVSFAVDEPESVVVRLALEYELKQSGPLRAVVDLLFIRRALADSLGRTLARLAIELESDRG